MPSISTTTASTFRTADITQITDTSEQETWFDAIDWVDMEDIWCDARDTFPVEQTSAEATAEFLIPFTEDFRRCIRQLISMLGDYKQSKMLSAAVAKMLPGLPVSIVMAADSLYIAITERRNIDSAVLQSLGLASGYLSDDINMIARLASFIRETLIGWTDASFLSQFLSGDENHTSGYLFTALAVTTVAARYWMSDENAPQRGFLRVPAFVANLLIRADHYWNALGHMACNGPPRGKIPLRKTAFEVDTCMETVRDAGCVAEGDALTAVITAFSSNSTLIPDAFIKATVQNRVMIASEQACSISEKAHFLMAERLKQLSGRFDLTRCETLKTETHQNSSWRVTTHTYLNTKCDAVAHPALSQTEANVQGHIAWPKTQRHSAARTQGVAPLITDRTTTIISYREPLNSMGVTGAALAFGLTHFLHYIDQLLTIKLLPTAKASLLSESQYAVSEENKRSIIKDIDKKVKGLSQKYNDFGNKIETFLFKKGLRALSDFYEEYNSKYPAIRSIASSVLKEKIKERFNLDVDPDQVYFMHFNNVLHDGGDRIQYPPARDKKTLTEWLFSNFSAETQVNLQDMDTMCGIYNTSIENHIEYHSSDALNIKPTDFIQLVWDIDFYDYANGKLTEALSHKDVHIKKLLLDFIIHLDVSNIDPDSAKDVLNGAGIFNDAGVSVSQFDIDGYSAANAFVFRNKFNKRVSLYLPESNFKFISFRDDIEMRSWVTNSCSSKKKRNMIASHFKVSNIQDGVFFSGIDTWLKSIGDDKKYNYYIAIKSDEVASDCFFEHYFNNMRDKTLSDLDSLIKSDAEIRRDMWEDMVDATNIIPNPVSPFLSLGIHLEHALEADTYSEKMQEWNNILYDGINIAAMIILDTLIKFPEMEGYEFISKVKMGIESGPAKIIKLDKAIDKGDLLFGKNTKYGIKKIRNLVSRFAITAESYQKINKIHDYDLYRVKHSGGKYIICLKIKDKFIPARVLNGRMNAYEIYNYKKPHKPGYPVFIDSDKIWHFGKVSGLIAKSEDNINFYPQISTRLHQLIHPSFYVKDVNLAKFKPINDHGIIKSHDGTMYLSLKDGYVRIKRTSTLNSIFELGPDNMDKVLCYYNRKMHQFFSVTDENNISQQVAEKLRVNTFNMDTESGLRGKFNRQKKLGSYREGFRGIDFDEYKVTTQIDNTISQKVKRIYFYGLNDDEISQAPKHKNIARKIKRDVINARDAIVVVKDHLLNAEYDSRIMGKFHHIFGISDNTDEAHFIFNVFMRNIEGTLNILEQHLAEDFKNIWLVKHKVNNIYALTFRYDPLKRIFINLKETEAYVRRHEKNFFRRLLCTVISERDDISTIIHETSHQGSGTDDFFYMGKNTLNTELERLYSGVMSKKEINAIINSDAALKSPPSFLIDSALAKNLFKNNPYVRAEFLMKNADSFTQIIIDLFDKTTGISKRDITSTTCANAEIIYLFISQQLSKQENSS